MRTWAIVVVGVLGAAGCNGDDAGGPPTMRSGGTECVGAQCNCGLSMCRCQVGTCEMSCFSEDPCEASCSRGNCDLECNAASSCNAVCTDSNVCTIFGATAGSVGVQCMEGAECRVECEGADPCEVDCRGSADCTVLCGDTPCMVDCQDASSICRCRGVGCGMRCPTGIMVVPCTDGSIACGECPV